MIGPSSHGDETAWPTVLPSGSRGGRRFTPFTETLSLPIGLALKCRRRISVGWSKSILVYHGGLQQHPRKAIQQHRPRPRPAQVQRREPSRTRTQSPFQRPGWKQFLAIPAASKVSAIMQDCPKAFSTSCVFWPESCEHLPGFSPSAQHDCEPRQHG